MVIGWRSPSPFAPEKRTWLSEFGAACAYNVVRDCLFFAPAKILTPCDDIVVPLTTESVVPDLVGRWGVSGVIARPDLAHLVPAEIGLALSDDPVSSLFALHSRLADMEDRLGARVPTQVSPSARISPESYVARYNVVIEDNVEIGPFVVVHERAVVRSGTRLHSHVVVASDAYEAAHIDGKQRLRRQTGSVVIGHNCEILPGTIISKAAFCGSTWIEDHVILDSSVVISHDAHIGEGVRIGGGAWIGGRVQVGRDVAIGPNSTISNGIKVGDRSHISLGSVVTKDVQPEARISGNFAIDHRRFINHMRTIR